MKSWISFSLQQVAQKGKGDRMKKCSDNVRCAFATAFLCLIWAVIAGWIGFPTWAGFTGCTAYFAAPNKGIKSLPVTFVCVASGIGYALLSLYIGQIIPSQSLGLFLTFLTTFLMCAGGSKRLLAFVPGAFMGSFSTFAGGGDIMTVAAILIGVFLGLACDSFGIFLCRLGKEK